MRALLAAMILATTMLGAQAGPKGDAYQTVERWAAAFDAGNVEAIAGLYAADASLWGTLSTTLATSQDALRRYFTAAAAAGFKVKLGDHSAVVVSDTTVVDAGQYEFSRVRDGQTTTFPARYSFVLAKRGDAWVIGHHHSSLLPRPQP